MSSDIVEIVHQSEVEGARYFCNILRVEQAAGYLTTSEDLDEIKDIRDKTQAIQHYMRAHGAAIGCQQSAAQIVLVAERRLGVLCKETTGGPGRKKGSAEEPFLSDLEITKKQSHNWQKLAAIPEPKFRDYLDDCLDHERIPTRAGALKFGGQPRKATQETKRPSITSDIATIKAVAGRIETLADFKSSIGGAALKPAEVKALIVAGRKLMSAIERLAEVEQ